MICWAVGHAIDMISEMLCGTARLGMQLAAGVLPAGASYLLGKMVSRATKSDLRVCRHGELSRAMRNRGVEVFVEGRGLDRKDDAVDVTGSMLESHGSAETQDLMALLSLQGVPGSALPRSMVDAHLAVAQEAARCHRHALKSAIFATIFDQKHHCYP